MTDLSETLARFRLPLRRDHLKQARAYAAPAMRYVPRNPLFFIGAGVLAIAGFVAWTQRDKIAATAGPLIDDARAKGQSLIDEARTMSQSLIDDASAKGHDLLEIAKAKGEVVAEKVASVRRGAAASPTPTDLN